MVVDSRVIAEVLLDDGRVDEAIRLVGPQQIAESWCRYTALMDSDQPGEVRGRESPDFRAIYLWGCPEFWADEERVRQGLLLLVDHAPDDGVLETVGAGPLEDFLRLDRRAVDPKQLEDRIGWIEAQAAGSPRFRQALAIVWTRALSKTQFDRLQAAAGVPLKPQSEPLRYTFRSDA